MTPLSRIKTTVPIPVTQPALLEPHLYNNPFEKCYTEILFFTSSRFSPLRSTQLTQYHEQFLLRQILRLDGKRHTFLCKNCEIAFILRCKTCDRHFPIIDHRSF